MQDSSQEFTVQDLAGQKADNWLLRQAPARYLNLPFIEVNEDELTEIMQSTFTLVMIIWMFLQMVNGKVSFTEKPAVFTREERSRHGLAQASDVALGF